jgi:hypothetical protein
LGEITGESDVRRLRIVRDGRRDDRDQAQNASEQRNNGSKAHSGPSRDDHPL